MNNKFKKIIGLANILFGFLGLMLVTFGGAGLDLAFVSWVNLYFGNESLKGLSKNENKD